MTQSIFLFISIIGAAGLAWAATPVSLQTRYISLRQQDVSTAIAADSSGNIFILSETFPQPTQPAIRVTKTDPQGNVVASFDYGANNTPHALAIDSEGNVFVAGTAAGSRIPGVPAGAALGSSAFVVKLDGGLAHVMASATLGNGSTGGTSALALAIDAAGSVYVTGTTWAPDFPTTPGAFETSVPIEGHLQEGPPFVPAYAFVSKFTGDLGTMVYSTYFGDDSLGCYSEVCIFHYATTTATGIVVDSTGAVTIVGSSDSVPMINGGAFDFQVSPYGFLAKFSSDGAALSAFVVMGVPGSALSVNPQTIAFDPSGSLLMAGTASAPPGYFGSNAIQPSMAVGVSDLQFGGFVAKYDAALQNLVWGTFFGDGDNGGVHAVALDGEGDVWITGSSQISTVPGANSSSTLTSSYVAEISPDGSSLLDMVLSQQLGGQAITAITGGSLAVLGASDSFLLSGAPDQPSLLTVANSANNGSSGTIAPAELISLYGTGIGPSGEMGGQVVNGAFTNSLGGYQVLFSGIPAPLLYAGPNQLNVVSPMAIAGRSTVEIWVVGPQGATVFPTVFVAPARPQIFSQFGPSGNPYVGVVNAIAVNQDGTVNSPKNPANGALTVWATGTGLAGWERPDGSIAPVTPPYQALPITARTNEIYVLPTPIEVTYAGDAPGAVLGLTQINLELSFSGTIAIEIGGVTSSYVYVY